MLLIIIDYHYINVIIIDLQHTFVTVTAATPIAALIVAVMSTPGAVLIGTVL